MAIGVTSCVDLRVPDPAVEIVAYGDSATAGPSTRDYVDFLADRLNLDPSKIANEGMGGATADEIGDHLDELLRLDIYPNARTILYWAGGNDVTDFIQRHDPLLLYAPDSNDYPPADQLEAQLDQLQDAISTAITRSRNAGQAIMVATYYPLPESSLNCPALPLNVLTSGQSVHANAYVTLLNDRIRLAALAGGAQVVNIAALGDVLLSDTDNYYNCDHLSEQGNAQVATLFADAIQSN